MKKKILLIGASTGGPSQIKEILSEINSLHSTIIIALHMGEEVLPYFIKELHNSIEHNIKISPVSSLCQKPEVIICSHSSVVKKTNGNYELVTQRENEIYTPDINKLFNSFVEYADEFEISVIIMTGIGSDGVEGAKNLKEKGAKVFAQDQESSPVYGMPKAALERGIVDKVLSLEDIKRYTRDI